MTKRLALPMLEGLGGLGSPSNRFLPAPAQAKRWLGIAGLALLYVLAAKLGQSLAIPPGNVTPVWLPSGIILAAVILRGPWVWPGIFIGAFLGNASAYLEVHSASQLALTVAAGLGNGVGDVLCAIVAAALLRNAGASYPFETVRQVLYFVLYGALLGPLLSAVFGVTSLMLTGLVPGPDYLQTFITWWTGDAVGVLLLAPLILSLYRPDRETNPRELALVAVTLIALAAALWWQGLILGPVGLSVGMALCIWSALRFGDRAVFACVLAVSAVAIVSVALDDQSALPMNRRLLELQLFVAVFSIALFVLRSTVNERASARVRLQRLNAELDARVDAKTGELADRNDELETSRARLETLFNQLAAGVVVHAPDTRILRTNPAAERILGLKAPEMTGKDASDSNWRFVDAGGRPLALADYPVNQILASAQPLTDFSMGVVSDHGSATRWLLVNGRPVLDENGTLQEIIVSFFDVSALSSAEQRLRNAEAVFQSTLEGILVTEPDGRIIDVNPAFTTITGYPREAVIGKTPSILKSGRHDRAFYAALWMILRDTGHWRGELWNRRADGEIYPEQLTISAVLGNDGEVTGYVGVFADISSIKASETRLDHLAHHDSLTGLPNRLLLRATLAHGISRARRFGSLMAVVFIDLDLFKQINDSLGHQSGDALLIEIAGRLLATVRETDTVARVSGDEFVVVMEDLAQPTQARVGVEKLMRSFATPFDLAGKQVRLTASIGVALYPQDGNEPEQLIGNADTAMYSAKNEGRNSFQFFTAELTRLAQETAVLDTALKSAQQQDEFTLVYQPQFSIATRALVSAEALLRWRRPGLGEVPPGRFIEIAEQNGLIAEIGSWVLLRACEQAAAWRSLGLVLERIAVNVSGQQVRTEAFADQVLDVLQRTGLPPTALEIEVTEHVMMRQVEHSVEQLVRLQNRGVSIAIDDFGTGYSSLSYLKVLPIDILKIDQSFVRDIEVDPDDRAIVESVIVLGKTLRKTIIAEGVESEAQLAFLRERGCDKAQGYLLGKPMAAADIETLLRQQGAAKTDSPGKAV